jgi:hypothetical protein
VVTYKYPPERLRAAAAASRTVADVLRHLGIAHSGGAHAHISRQLRRFGVDTGHFTGRAARRGTSPVLVPPDDLLVVNTPGARRVPGFRLRRALLRLGVAECCAVCGTGTTWQGRPLTLHVDHISGDFLDNRPGNLRLLCPNCHSQTATYAGNNRAAP